MPRANPQERRRKLQEKQARLKAELQRLDARERQAKRKHETRRKILLGAMVLDRIARGVVTEKLVLADMDSFLERDQDRALFDLPPRSASTAATEGEEHA